MSDPEPPPYPDISDILARKAAARREIAARSFGEKLDMLDAMRERLEPMRRAAELRRRNRASAAATNRSDDELKALAALEGTWIMRAGESVWASLGTLRTALEHAKRLSALGEPVTHIIRAPHNDPCLIGDEIAHLSHRLGI